MMVSTRPMTIEGIAENIQCPTDFVTTLVMDWVEDTLA
jgi:hypothetical protein